MNKRHDIHNIRAVLRTSLIAAAAMLLPSTVFATDLMDAYEQALRADPTLMAAAESRAAGAEKRVQGNALLLPQVGLTGSVVRVDDRSSTGLPPAFSELIKDHSSGTVSEAAVQLVQPLYDASAFAERRQLRQQAELADIGYRQAQQDLMRRVSETYFDLLLAQETLRVAQAEKAAMTMQRDRAQARFDVGRGRITDVQEAQARYDAALTRVVAAEGTLALRHAQYVELTGVAAQAIAGLRAGFDLPPAESLGLAAWQARGLDGNAQVLGKQAELAIATAEVGKYRLKARPTLDLVASYTRKEQNGDLSPAIAPDRSSNSVIGMQLTVPLFTGGGLRSRERESLARQRQAEQELLAVKRDVRLQIQEAYLAVTTGRSKVAALTQSEQSAQSALDATVLARDIGTRTELDVLDAQQHLYRTQLDLAEARHDLLLGHVRLAAAAGALRIAHLEALNSCLSEA